MTESSNAQVRTAEWVVIKSAMNENRNLRVREHFDGFAAEDDCRNPATAMRRHYNEVATFRFCGINDGPIRMFVLDLDSLTRNARRIRRLSDSAEQFGSVCLNTLLILVNRVFDNLRVECENMKWHGDGKYRNFGADLFGKSHSMLYRLGGQFRTVRGYQNALVHDLSPSRVAQVKAFKFTRESPNAHRSNLDCPFH